VKVSTLCTTWSISIINFFAIFCTPTTPLGGSTEDSPIVSREY